MTKNQFINALSVVGGQFVFANNKYEGMIGVSMSGVVIWVDDKGFGDLPGNLEPRNIGEFNSVGELLTDFKVDGKYFANDVLPEISELLQICT